MTEENVNQEEVHEEHQEVEANEVESNENVEVAASEAEPVEVAPTYTPDFTYKVNKEVREIPEHYRSFITDADREKEFRDIMERADGIHDVKAHRDRLVKEIDEQYKPANDILNQANSYLSQGDLQGFFEYSGLKDEDIFNYALKRLELKENPDKARAYEQQRYIQSQNTELQNQVNRLQEQYNQQAAAQRINELDSYLSRPENLEVVNTYDAQVGTPGAFRQEVIRRGQYYAQVNNLDRSVEELYREISAPFAGFVGQQNQSGIQTTPSGVVTGGGNQGKPTLPKLQGRGGSPVRKTTYRSVADLRKREAEL